MAEIKWIKYYIDFFNKKEVRDYILLLPESDAIIVIWFELQAMAGECNTNGFIFLTEDIPYTEEMLANKFRKNVSIVRLALSTFHKLGMLEFVDGKILLTGFDDEQNIDGMEKIKEQTRQRVIRHRQKLKLLEPPKGELYVTENETQSNATCNVTGNVVCNGEETQCNATDLDQDLEKEYNTISSENSFGLEGDEPKNILPIPPEGKLEHHQNIFKAWNSINVIIHRQITPEIKNDINSAMKKGSKESIVKAIERYGKMYHDQTYYLCNYKWGIHEFLTRKEGFLRFLDDGSKWLNYQEHTKNPGQKPNQQAPPAAPQAQNFKQRQYSQEFYDKIKGVGIKP